MSDVTTSWIGLSLGAFAAGAAIVGILALRRAFEPLIAILGAIGMAVAGWSLVAVGQAYGTPQLVVFAVLFAIATGAGGYAFASALLDYLARPAPAALPLDADEIGESESRPVVFLVAPVETQDYEPRGTARELHDLADEGVLRLGIGVTPFLFAASKARYRASGGKSPAWREFERLTEAVEQRLDASLHGTRTPVVVRRVPGARPNASRRRDWRGPGRSPSSPWRSRSRRNTRRARTASTPWGYRRRACSVEYAPPLWSSDAVAESVARHIIAGAINPDSTGVVLVLHGQPGPTQPTIPPLRRGGERLRQPDPDAGQRGGNPVGERPDGVGRVGTTRCHLGSTAPCRAGMRQGPRLPRGIPVRLHRDAAGDPADGAPGAGGRVPVVMLPDVARRRGRGRRAGTRSGDSARRRHRSTG